MSMSLYGTENYTARAVLLKMPMSVALINPNFFSQFSEACLKTELQNN